MPKDRIKSSVTAVEEFIAALPEDRRHAVSAVRTAILKTIPPGYEEMILMGGISYAIPLSRFPKTYNGYPLTIACITSTKSHMAVHLMGIYGSAKLRDWFVAEYKKSGKKFDAGKACVRFKKLEDLPVDLIAQTAGRVSVEQFIAVHEQAQAMKKAAKGKAPRKPPASASNKKPRPK
ncbi:MAG TPA: DUF1801 domain-containing protein [Phycisphaerae bacterium]